MSGGRSWKRVSVRIHYDRQNKVLTFCVTLAFCSLTSRKRILFFSIMMTQLFTLLASFLFVQVTRNGACTVSSI